jgi:hypothetical protein
MKTLSPLLTGTACLALLACSTAAEPPSSNQAGAGSAAGSGNSAGGLGAGNGSGGSGATAGSASGATSGGSAPAAGTNAGGSVGVGGSAGGNSGATAGTSNSAAGTGGTNAAGGTGGSTSTVDTTLTGAWDGALLQYGCGSSGTSYDCAQPSSAQCAKFNAQSNPKVSEIPPTNGVSPTWTMGGTTGTNYDVTFRLRGIIEVNSYTDGERQAGDASILTTPRDTFHVGGTAQLNGGPSFDYNTYELLVTPAGGGAPQVYWLNSVTNAQNPHASGSPSTHLTFDVDYTATIKVPGGAKVAVIVTDSNCTQVQNCGPTTGGTCQAPRSLALTGSMPAAPSFAQPLVNNNLYGQWIFFDVTEVVIAP